MYTSLCVHHRTGASFPVADVEDVLHTPAGSLRGVPLVPHAPPRLSPRQAEAAPPPSLSVTVLKVALNRSAAIVVLPYVRKGDAAELRSLAARLSSLAVGGASRGLLGGTDVWSDRQHLVRGGLVAASEIERQRTMARSEVVALPHDAAARLAFALDVERRRRELAGGGGDGSAAAAAAAGGGFATPPFSAPMTSLQRAELLLRRRGQQRVLVPAGEEGCGSAASEAPAAASSAPAASSGSLPRRRAASYSGADVAQPYGIADVAQYRFKAVR